jgi:predicted HAD superfamily Cof-like phosphohydrolase
MVSNFEPMADMEQFFQKFQLAYDGPPRELPGDLEQFRVTFMAEELCEYAGLDDTAKRLVQSALITSSEHRELDEKLDALIDLVYVVLGTSQFHGFDFREGWRRVHAANMTKRRIQKGDKGRHMVYDIVKPEDFSPPDLSDLCRGS